MNARSDEIGLSNISVECSSSKLVNQWLIDHDGQLRVLGHFAASILVIVNHKLFLGKGPSPRYNPAMPASIAPELFLPGEGFFIASRCF
jgi:hypothetical protein